MSLQKVNELIAERTKQQRVLNELYTALNVIDIEVIIEIMEDSFLYREDCYRARPFIITLMENERKYGVWYINSGKMIYTLGL